jgi:hypothetical protein
MVCAFVCELTVDKDFEYMNSHCPSKKQKWMPCLATSFDHVILLYPEQLGRNLAELIWVRKMARKMPFCD